MIKIKKRYLILLFFLAISIRMIYINSDLFHHDSVEYARDLELSVSSGNLQSGVSDRILYMIINLPFYIFFKNAYLSLNFVTILFAGLSIIMLYLFLSQIISRNAAYIAAILFCFSPLYLSITSYPKAHSVALFFVFLSLYLFRWNGWASGIVFCISLLARSDNIVYLPLFYLLSYYYKKDLSKVYKPLSIIVFFLLINMKGNFLNKAVYSLIPFHFISSSLTATIHYLIHSLSIFVFLLIFFTFGLIYSVKTKVVTFLSIWFMLVSLPFVFIDVITPRYFIHAIIPLFVLIGIFLDFVTKNLKFYVVIVVVCLILLMITSIHPVLWYRHTNPTVSNFINNLPNDLPYVLEDYAIMSKYYGNLTIISPTKYAGGLAYTTNRVLDIYNLSDKKVAILNLTLDYHYRSELALNLHNVTIYKIGD